MDERIKPVAWKCVWIADGDGCNWEQYHDEGDPMPERWDDAPDEITHLYSQQSIDALRAEVERLRAENQMLGEVALAVPGEIDRVSKLKDGVVDFLVARAERAEAEAEELRALCRDMLPVFEAARPLVLNLERLRDAARKVTE